MPDSGKNLGMNSSPEVVALIGAPNSGKTTLYNWITNSKFRTVNYPGATVEYSIGQSDKKLSYQFMAMDTPGTYSLFPKSADEEVTLKALYDFHQFGKVKKVILVVDGSQLERHLLVAEQLKQSGFSFLLVVTMNDLLLKNKIQLDPSVLEKEFGCQVVLFDGVRGKGLFEIIEKIKEMSGQEGQRLSPWTDAQATAVQTKLQKVVEQTLGKHNNAYAIYDRTAKIDQLLLHPFFGLLLFFLIMTFIFSSIFLFAKPFMDGIDHLLTMLGSGIQQAGAGALWADFVSDGVIASFSAVLVFVPQIFILFLGIGVLESTGYLARAATLIDRPFSKLGMSGRSFVPILSGFACAVPAMMATRNIPSKRDRMITNFILPLMTCSARLPVYSLLLTFLFLNQPAWIAGVTLALIYLSSLFIGAFAAGILHKILKRNERGFFMMELPLYRAPRLKVLISQSLSRTKSYVQRAGPMIFLFSILIWVGSTFPNYKAENQNEKLQSSYLAQAGHAIEPIFTPMGGDWRVGVGLLSAFAAREVFVSSMAIVFNITDDNEDSQRESLLKSMNEATNQAGQKIFTISSVLGLILFFMIALQCMTTFAVAVRESGSVAFALAQLILFNVGAYALTVALVQGLRAMGIA